MLASADAQTELQVSESDPSLRLRLDTLCGPGSGTMVRVLMRSWGLKDSGDETQYPGKSESGKFKS